MRATALQHLVGRGRLVLPAAQRGAIMCPVDHPYRGPLLLNSRVIRWLVGYNRVNRGCSSKGLREGRDLTSWRPRGRCRSPCSRRSPSRLSPYYRWIRSARGSPCRWLPRWRR
eukprot:1617852-Pyramimonas_sp.AAC.1